MQTQMDFFRNVLKLSDTSLLSELEQVSKCRKWKKKDIITKIGDVCTSVDFLVEGLFRGYYINSRGQEITDCLGYISGTPIVSCLGIGKPSPICLEFLENSVTVSIPSQVMNALFYSNYEMMILYNNFLQLSLQMHWETKIVISQSTAEERYKWFLKKYPGLIDRIKHKYVASFLGITPVSLSRVRKKEVNNV